MSGLLDRMLVTLRSVLGTWRFATPGGYGRYRGIHGTPEEAQAAAPRSARLGYDHADLAQAYRDQHHTAIGFYDYPMLFWLQRLLRPDLRVFDFGGNIGTHFYAYERYLGYPPGLRWTVCELPALVAAGEALARQESRTEIAFTTRFEDAEGADVLLASGSVQYVGDFPARLAALRDPPRHVLLGRMPMCEGPSFVTLQNGGMVFYPVHVVQRSALERALRDAGYRIVDTWKDPGEPVAVPFHPEFRTMSFHGYHLARDDPSRGAP